MSQLRQLGIANEVFMEDHQGKLPGRYTYAGAVGDGGPNLWRPWYLWSLAPYLNLERSTSNTSLIEPRYDGGSSRKLSTLCPTDQAGGWWDQLGSSDASRGRPASYAILIRWLELGDWAGNIPTANPAAMSFEVFPKRDAVISPAQSMYLTDAGWDLRGRRA